MSTAFPSQTSLFSEGRVEDFLSCMSMDGLGVEVADIAGEAKLWHFLTHLMLA